MLLDRGLPAIEGLDLLARLRRPGRYTPTLVLSALGNPRDRVDGLDAGAEDYLGKPFDVDELLARLRALLRRHARPRRRARRPRRRADRSTRSVRSPTGGEVALSERESTLLALLARNPRRVFRRPSCSTRSSRPPRRKVSWTPTCTTCDASSAAGSWRRCADSATGSGAA